MVQAAGGAQCLVFTQVSQVDAGELPGRVLDEVAEDGLVVVADDVDLLDLLDARNGVEAVPDDGVASNVEERLGEVERQRAESSAARRTTDLDRGGRREEHVSCCLQCEMVRLHGGVRLETAVQSFIEVQQTGASRQI